jgi:hypothetical protein
MTTPTSLDLPASPSARAAPTYPFKWTRRVVVLLGCLCLSLLAAVLTAKVVVRIDNSGALVSWQRLPDPPAAVTSLAVAGVGDVVAELASGERVILPFRADTWQTADGQPMPAAAPCSPPLPEWPRTTHPPAGATLCVSQWDRGGTDCDQRVAYALDGDGRVWGWQKGTCALGLLGLGLFTSAASGLVYLLLSAPAALVWLRRRERAGR